MDKSYSISEKRNDKNKIDALVASAKNNDKYAFVELTGVFSPYIKSLAHTFNVSYNEYDDLYQEGRIALYKAVCSFDDRKASFITYARVCIKNAMTSFIRTYSAEKKNSACSVSLDDNENEFASLMTEITPEDALIAREFIKELESAIDTILSDIEKTVIKYKLSGIGATEISIIVGKDIKSVENTLFRARKKLRDYLSNT